MSTSSTPPRPPRTPRQRVLKSGIVIFSGGHSTINCAIRDVSEVGARLQFELISGPPDTFVLRMELDGIEADCEVTWRRGKEVGVHFLGPPRALPLTRKQVVTPTRSGQPQVSLRRAPRTTK